MKKYVLKDLNDPSKYKVEWRSSAVGTLCEAPDEDVNVLDVEETTDENGLPVWVATINAQKVADKAAAENAAELEKQANQYKDERRRAYPDLHDVAEALMEAEEGRTAKLDAVKAQRALVKAQYPKGS
jgi:hypothetical protein